jgi:acyl carrier protein
MESIPLEQGLEILGKFLGQDGTQVGVLPVNWSKFCQQFPQGVTSRFLESFAIPLAETSVRQTEFLQQLETAPVNQRRSLLMTGIQTEVSKLLGFDVGQLEPQQSFFDMGMDSLMAVELKNHLERIIGCSLPVTLAFDHPTLEGLVDYLMKAISAEFSHESAVELEETNNEEQIVAESDLDDLSDSEAEALLIGKLESMRY